MKPFLCRLGRHAPVRRKAVMDINDFSQETYCKRCGAAMERETGGSWRLRDAT
jgi:hypothetical protein